MAQAANWPLCTHISLGDDPGWTLPSTSTDPTAAELAGVSPHLRLALDGKGSSAISHLPFKFTASLDTPCLSPASPPSCPLLLHSHPVLLEPGAIQALLLPWSQLPSPQPAARGGGPALGRVSSPHAHSCKPRCISLAPSGEPSTSCTAPGSTRLLCGAHLAGSCLVPVHPALCLHRLQEMEEVR